MIVKCGNYLLNIYFTIMVFSLDVVLMKMANLKLELIKEWIMQKNKQMFFPLIKNSLYVKIAST